VKHFQRPITEQQLNALRKAAEEAGRTLGDALVIVGLAEPDELRLTENDDAGKTS
jgi:nucleotide-binding universal stress UspA family protein